jgi:hypothetical protein
VIREGKNTQAHTHWHDTVRQFPPYKVRNVDGERLPGCVFSGYVGKSDLGSHFDALGMSVAVQKYGPLCCNCCSFSKCQRWSCFLPSWSSWQPCCAVEEISRSGNECETWLSLSKWRVKMALTVKAKQFRGYNLQHPGWNLRNNIRAHSSKPTIKWFHMGTQYAFSRWKPIRLNEKFNAVEAQGSIPLLRKNQPLNRVLNVFNPPHAHITHFFKSAFNTILP